MYILYIYIVHGTLAVIWLLDCEYYIALAWMCFIFIKSVGKLLHKIWYRLEKCSAAICKAIEIEHTITVHKGVLKHVLDTSLARVVAFITFHSGRNRKSRLLWSRERGKCWYLHLFKWGGRFYVYLNRFEIRLIVLNKRSFWMFKIRAVTVNDP